MEDITADEFAKLVASKKDIQLLDVREELEFHTYNVGGLNIPLGKINHVLEEEEFIFDINEEIIVICQRGLRSKTAKTILINAGYKNVRNLIGGLLKLQRVISK
ncbi:MAG: rhodanese-like domain-containing protein [Pelobium sp.]